MTAKESEKPGELSKEKALANGEFRCREVDLELRELRRVESTGVTAGVARLPMRPADPELDAGVVVETIIIAVAGVAHGRKRAVARGRTVARRRVTCKYAVVS